MENKKSGSYMNTGNTPTSGTIINKTVSKHAHQHNTTPQQLRLLQYGLKIPSHQHTSVNQSPTTHQHQLPSVVPHQHQYRSQSPYQTQSSHQHQVNLNVYPNSTVSQSLYTQQNQTLRPNHFHSQNTNHSFTPSYSVNSDQHNSKLRNSQQSQGHYHPQQQLQQAELQLSGPQTYYYSSTIPLNLKSSDVERKKVSNNQTQQLRSPFAKRPMEAPVTIQGWLHKQGSDGLMLWKKRWFVLSEYCLFYYKSSEEEKLLGSILLPSYKVSKCKPEDKVNRKFAFKCEHTNMRTYILAADSQELMLQWLRHLAMACLLQNTCEKEKQFTQHSSSNESLDNPSTRSQQTVQIKNLRNTPVHMHSSSNTTDLSNTSQQELVQYTQPLYANAPPKPRRLTDGYSSPTSELLDRYGNESKYALQQSHHCHAQPNLMTRSILKSPVNICANPQIHPDYLPEFVQQQMFNKRLHISDENSSLIKENNAERRTPDTYGRSKLNSSQKSYPSDYEDVYTEHCIYKRPLSPISYKDDNRVNSSTRPFTAVIMRDSKDNTIYAPFQRFQKKPNSIPRPHSADFLEYEGKRQDLNVIVRQPRPKSSLDINKHTNDNYFYTEERYAEKMRKSTQYLPKISKYSNTQNEHEVNQQKLQNTIPLIRSTNPFLNSNDTNIYPREQLPLRSRSVLSDSSLLKEVDMEQFNKDINNTEFQTKNDQFYKYNDNMHRLTRDTEQFTRSASARLTQNCNQFDGRSVNRDGERKREESMKRLLEWKQRMLQSPLNRKVNQTIQKAVSAKYNQYYKSTDDEYAYLNYNVYGDLKKSTHTLPQYNSYSSDDEENMDGSKENVQTQAGRTTDTFPSISNAHIPALIASTTVFNSLTCSTEFLNMSAAMHCPPQHLNAVTKLPVVCTSSLEPHKLHNSSGKITQDNEELKKPLKVIPKSSTHTAHVSSLRYEFIGKSETEKNSTGGVIQRIFTEFEKNVDGDDLYNFETPTDNSNKLQQTSKLTYENTEENYMTMTPKKNLLESSDAQSLLTMILNSEIEENPYVEMTQSLNTSILDSNIDNLHISDLRAYERICFQNRKSEPVYVELNNIDFDGNCTHNTSNDSRDHSKFQLPHIMIGLENKDQSSISNKSDCSDADDEASKDLDSLDTLCNPRFSLSDTFRPASYYLGASKIVPELQDSSDSEIVSPPPIPTSPPPSDDLENGEECISSNQDIISIENAHKEYIYRYNLQDHKTDNFFDPTDSSFKKSTIIFSEQDNLPSYNISTNNAERHYNKISHNNECDLELSNLTKAIDYERRLKRRPVSEEFYNELVNLDNNPTQFFNASYIDTYLKHLEGDNRASAIGDAIKENISDDENDSTHHHDCKNTYHAEEAQKLKKQSDNELISTTAIAYNNDLVNIIESQTTKDKTDANISSFFSNDFDLRTYTHSRYSLKREANRLPVSASTQLTPIHNLEDSLDSQDTELSFSLSDQKLKSSGLDSFTNQSAPYYYSDLSVNSLRSNSSNSILTLNNQRSSMIGSKRDITRIMNPIRCNSRINDAISLRYQDMFDSTFKLAAEARSASVDFLNIADKSGNIDKKNIYESDTLKRLKVADSTSSLRCKSERNLFLSNKEEKFSIGEKRNETYIRRSYSLEGLLENVLTDNRSFSQDVNEPVDENNASATSVGEGSHLWEEDSIWHDRLRSVSQRHTRSLDDLDCIKKIKTRTKKHTRGISRLVTYVNDNMFNMPMIDKEQMALENKKDDIKMETKEAGCFIIDREKLRQWDFLSSAPSDAQLFPQAPIHGCINSVVDLSSGVSVCETPKKSSVQNAASGSIPITTRDTLPRTIVTKKTWTPATTSLQSKSIANLTNNYENDYLLLNRFQQDHLIPQGHNHHNLSSETSQSSNSRYANWQMGEKMNVSAGELLGRTHEELVLLLIQLRRQSANNCNSIEACYNEIESIQSNLPEMDAARRLQNLQKLEIIKQHLLELEKQYEKGKPLVNLVDNMVKLGSLYRFPKDYNNYPYVKNRLDFNQQMQERRLLAEERKDWNRLSSNQTELQAKVQQLYQLDRLIQEESETLQGLQQDKEEIERALGGLRNRLIKGFKDPAEVVQARKQQILLENELSRVHSMLAQNSRKLEETVAGNARLEQELLVLKQKLQIARQQRSSPQISNAGDSLPCVIGTSAMLESDLHRVQQKVGDLQKQRQELSIQVRQLTDRSNSLQQIKLLPAQHNQLVQSNKKKINSQWRETDLDTMNSIDHGETWENSIASLTPLYVNTNLKQNEGFNLPYDYKSSEFTHDDMAQNQSLLPQEKQEIKTVRIVKRESERRQRDREKTVTGKWDAVIEEEDSQNSKNITKSCVVQKFTNNTSKETDIINKSEPEMLNCSVPMKQHSQSNPSLSHMYLDVQSNSSVSVEENINNSSELLPVFKSEAARQIIIEMASQDVPKRRTIPREKRRHYTAPHNNLIMKSLNNLPTDEKDFEKLDTRRARDDLDMERALRQRIDTPDVVRSTLSNKEFKYNESTIDNILGTPNKIFIPERYVPEQLPQLSVEEQQHRLKKVESIKKMLSDTAIISGSTASLIPEESNLENQSNNVSSKSTSKIIEEKKQREHLLQLNQLLAKQVMEMSKIVAVKALAALPLEHEKSSSDEELSPDMPLPIFQQRDNFYS